MANWISKAVCLPGCASRKRCAACGGLKRDFRHSAAAEDLGHDFTHQPCDCGRVQAAQEWEGMVKDAMAYRELLATHDCDLKDFGGCGPVELCLPCEAKAKLKAARVGRG